MFNDLSLISYSLDKEKDEDESQIALILDPERLSTYQKMIHCYMTVRFIHDRGFTHELVRMRRDCSYSQESTRYCNYSDGKGNDIKYRCVIDGEIDTEELFNTNIVWYGGTPDANGCSIETSKPEEITWTLVKAEMDKL